MGQYSGVTATSKLQNRNKKRSLSNSKNKICHTNKLFETLEIQKLKDLIRINTCRFSWNTINKKVPKSLHNTLQLKISGRSTRSQDFVNLAEHLIRTKKEENSLFYQAPKIWNDLELAIKLSTSVKSLTKNLKESTQKDYKNKEPCNKPNCISCQ